MIPPEEISRLAGGLSQDARDLLLQCLPHWFRATDLSWSRPGPTGHALSRLFERGLLERKPDETKWGRSKYRLSEPGIALRNHLETTK